MLVPKASPSSSTYNSVSNTSIIQTTIPIPVTSTPIVDITSKQTDQDITDYLTKNIKTTNFDEFYNLTKNYYGWANIEKNVSMDWDSTDYQNNGMTKNETILGTKYNIKIKADFLYNKTSLYYTNTALEQLLNLYTSDYYSDKTPPVAYTNLFKQLINNKNGKKLIYVSVSKDQNEVKICCGRDVPVSTVEGYIFFEN